MDILKTLTKNKLISSRIRSKLVKSFHRENYDFVENFYGLKYSGNTASYIDRFVYYMGGYEIGILNKIKELKQEYNIDSFVDIGANVGHHSLFASTLFKRVISFEPYPVVLQQFKNNIINNSIKNIELCEYGIGETDTTLKYYEPEGENKGTGSFIENFSGNNKYQQLDLEIRSGDVLSELNIKNPIIKIDTEGFEASVLKGIQKFLESNPSIIIVEVSDPSKFSHEINEFILRSYKILLIQNQFRESLKADEVNEISGRESYYILIDKRF